MGEDSSEIGRYCSITLLSADSKAINASSSSLFRDALTRPSKQSMKATFFQKILEAPCVMPASFH